MKTPRPLKYMLIAIVIAGAAFIIATAVLFFRYGRYVGGIH